jgi:hypothetical protein
MKKQETCDLNRIAANGRPQYRNTLSKDTETMSVNFTGETGASLQKIYQQS